jgi:hypothetical protein
MSPLPDEACVKDEIFNEDSVILHVAQGDAYKYGGELPSALKSRLKFDEFTPSEVNPKYAITPAKGALGQEYYIVNSAPFDYPHADKVHRLMDVVFATSNMEEAALKIQKLEEYAASVREYYDRFVTEKLLPSLTANENIVGLIGRGSVYDVNRIPGPDDDLDIMVLVESTDAMPSVKDTMKGIKGFRVDLIEYSITVEASSVGRQGQGYSSINGETAYPVVSFDLIPFDGVKKLIAHPSLGSAGSEKMLGNYATHAFKDGTLLYEKEVGSVSKLRDALG